MVDGVRRPEIHYWSEPLTEPPCGTLDDRIEWSDRIESVTCEGCLEALAGDGGDLAAPREEWDSPEPSGP